MPEYLSVFHAHLLQAGQRHGKESCRLKVTGKEGPPFHALIETMAVADDDGAFDYYRLCLTDITQLTRQEELAYLSTFPVLSPNPIVEVNTTGAIQFMNPAAERLFPDLRVLGRQHPWLRDWETIRILFLADKAKDTSREIQIGDRWFEQAFYLVEDTGKIRIYGREITTQKKAHVAREESEERYRLLVESSPDGVIVFRKGMVLFANKVALSMFGANTLAELKTTKIMDFVHPDDHVGMDAWVQQGQTGEGLPLREVRIVSTDGRVVPVEVVGTLIYSQELSAIQVIIRDITVRKTKEGEIKRLNRTLRALGGSIQAMMRATDLAGYLEEVCRIITEECGHTMVWIGFAEQDEGKSVRVMAHAGFDGGYLETLKLTWADSERGRGPTGMTIRTGKPDMCHNILTDPRFKPWKKEALNRGYASSIALPLLSEGKAFGALTIYSGAPDPFSEDEQKLLTELAADLSFGITSIRLRAAHAQAEEELRKSEESYRSLFNAMTEGFALHEIVCDDTGTPCDYRFLDINPAFERLTGLKRDEVIGRLYGDILPDDGQKWIKIYEEVALTGNPVHFENYSPALKRHYEVYAYRPAPRQFAVIFMDISERKQTEIALQERTLQLENANKEMENFSYSFSHDLRAPLRAVDGYARMILKKHEADFDKDTLDKFNVIRSNARKINMLIDDLLTFSRMSRAHMSMFNIKMDDLFRETWTDLQSLYPQRPMSLKINPVPPGKGDRALIKQVLNHILSNAVKFTKAHEKTLVEVGGAEQGNEIVYYIRDGGIGFDMKYNERLFGVFQRLHTDEEYEGTGVGLALVKRIIHRHGGRVWAEGEVDRGACFYFTLPKV
jgi:PAS domain S-box-containing protein